VLKLNGISKKLLDSFLGGKLFFSIDNNHTNTSNYNNPEKLIDLISKVNKNKNYTATLVYNSSFLNKKDYLKTIKEVNKNTICSLHDAKFWWYSDVPKTDKLGNGNEFFFNNYIHYSRRRSIDEKKELFFGKVYLIIEKTLPRILTNYIKKMYYLVDFIIKKKSANG